MFEIGFRGNEHAESSRKMEKIIATCDERHGVGSRVELFVKRLGDCNTSRSSANNDDTELGCHEGCERNLQESGI